jgi:hypothetical protein
LPNKITGMSARSKMNGRERKPCHNFNRPYKRNWFRIRSWRASGRWSKGCVRIGKGELDRMYGQAPDDLESGLAAAHDVSANAVVKRGALVHVSLCGHH